ncbi:MAG: endonuclease domain-containing protein [Bacteroidota bacterium]
MSKIFNRPDQKEKRRFLRRHATASERIMWQVLRGKQLLGYKFRRQYSIGAFVVDFYSSKLKLVIELDGRSHRSLSAREYDSMRQIWIEKYGIRFLRFKDEDVINKTKEVICKIKEFITMEAKGAGSV